MKVLHLDYDDLKNPYAGGGQAKDTKDIFGRLATDHEVTVVTGNYPMAKNEEINGIRHIRIGIGSFGPTVSLLSYWFFLPFFIMFNSKKYHLVSEFFTAPFGPSLVPIFSFVPVIATGTFLSANEMSKKYHLPFELVENFCIKYYKNIIALTESSKKYLLSKNSKLNIRVIYRGVDDEILNLHFSNEGYALYLGRIDVYGKGLDLILDSWKIVESVLPSVKLMIAGNGKDGDMLELSNIIKKNNLKNVFMVGRVEGKKKLDILKKCSLVVNATKYGYFGIVSLEAMAAGKPLICFDIPGFDWIPASVAIKVEPFDSRAMAKSIIKIFNDPKYQLNVSRNAKNFSKLFSWKKIISEHNKFINDVLPLNTV